MVKQKIKFSKASVVFMLAIFCTALLGLSTLVVRNASPGEEDVKHVNSPPSYFLDDAESSFIAEEVDKLNASYNLKLGEDSQAVLNYIAKVAADTEKQREQAALKAEKQRSFFEQQAELQRRLAEMRAELDEKAMQGIADENGQIFYVDGTVVRPDEYLNQNNTQGSMNVTNTTTEQPAEIDPKERGQFKARFICTCSSCFDPTQWPEANLATNTILADTKYLPAGGQVKIVEYNSEIYTVVNGSGEVSGREVVVFMAEHNASLCDKQMYIKIRDK